MAEKNQGAAAQETPMPFRDDEMVVRLKDVSLYYKLYEDPKHRLREALNPFGKTYHRKFYALRDVSLDVPKGTVIGILGKNGSGKSTLLKIIARILQPSSGAVTVRGNVRAMLELGAGFNPEFSGLENIYFLGAVYGFSSAEMEERLEEIAAFADIGDYLRQPVKTYSSGMRARLAFAMSINVDPDIFILDEVLAVGDERFKRKCYAKMEEILESSKTIFYVSHSVEEVLRICTRAILLDQGEVLIDGPPKLVTGQYQKLLYAEKQNVQTAKEEIRRLRVHAFEAVKMGARPQEPGRGPRGVFDENLQAPSDGTGESGGGEEALFVPDFVSKARKEQRTGASLSDIVIRNTEGAQVNMMVMNEEYVLSFRTTLAVDAERVFFAFRIATVAGLPVSGLRSDKVGETIDVVSKGDEYEVRCRFSCNLLPGTYAVDVSANCVRHEDVVILGGVADALLFKVLPVRGREFFGVVNLNSRVSIEKVPGGGNPAGDPS